VDSSILRFDAMAAAELFASASPIPLHLLRSLGQKIRLLTFQVESMTFLSVKKRVGATLLGLFENFGKTEEDGFRLDIQITDQELAYLIGTRREAVTKAIVELKNLGFLHKEKRVLYFDDVKALKEFVTEDED
jgi:CRP/FNR family transcriptional regulator